MSDVWQGPGWWLASDGKWYPADAEPGAVYEGDLSNTEAQEQTSATATSVVEAELPTPDMTDVAPEVETNSGEVDLPIFGSPGSGADPFAQMPAPGVMPEAEPAMPVEEARVAGWQAITPEPEAFEPPAPTNLDEAVVDDGWTSAYEERQATGEVLDEIVTVDGFTAPPAPTIDLPTMEAPGITPASGIDLSDISGVVPEIPIPDVAMPDLSTPDVAIPDVTMPDVAVPDVAIPDVAMPDVSAPDVHIPEVTMPDVGIPDVAMPDVGIPDVAMPDVAMPDVTIPDVAIPDVAVPDVAIPDIAMPDMGIPDIAAPAAAFAGDSPARDQAAPIEREDAWRKPLAPEATAPRQEATIPRTGTPDVVDLALRDEPIDHVEPSGPNWKLIGGLLLGLLAICAIAWLIASLFSGNTTDTGTDATTSSTQTETTDVDTPDSTAEPVTETTGTTSTSDSQVASVFDLRAGDCIIGDIGAGQVTKVEKVDCEIEHQFEVYREALIDSSITAFDEEAISGYAEEVCRTSLAAYVPAEDDRGLKFKFLQPTEDSWNQEEDPDRVITCLLFDDDAPLIGRAA